jgi:hypothetical protein
VGQCTTTRGTIVAVDFGHWGGPIVRGCGVGAANGLQLLGDGGFTTAGTRRDGAAFVCRLGSGSFAGGTQYPTPSQDACNVTPPASADWSYWLAAPGATSWHYSDSGAANDHPVGGEVELWTFGGTNSSGTSGSAVPANSLIDQLRAHNASPTGGTPATTKTPVRTTAAPAGGAPSATRRGSTSPGAAAIRTGSASGSPTASGPSTSASSSPTTSSTTTPFAEGAPSSSPAIVAARPTAAGHHSSGSVLPVVITAVILAALGGFGGLSALRRRRTDGD